MKKVTMAVLASLLLTGCTAQLDKDKEACRLLAVMHGSNVYTFQEYESLKAELGQLANNDETLATRINRIAEDLDPHFVIGEDDFVSNLLDWKSEKPIDYEQFREEYQQIRSDCPDARETSNVTGWTLDLSVRDVERRLERETDLCLNYMYLASITEDNDEAERFIERTSDTCEGASAWYEALRTYPYALGFPNVTNTELDILCFAYPKSRVCTNP